jgi:hypothetical protein
VSVAVCSSVGLRETDDERDGSPVRLSDVDRDCEGVVSSVTVMVADGVLDAVGVTSLVSDGVNSESETVSVVVVVTDSVKVSV